MLEGLAVWALFIYLLRLVGMPWNTYTKGFAYLGGGGWLLFVWVGLLNYTPMDLSGGSVVQSPHIQLRPGSSQIQGQVSAIHIHPNQRVEKGQLVYELEDETYQIALSQERVNLDAKQVAQQSAQEAIAIAESEHQSALKEITITGKRIDAAEEDLNWKRATLRRFEEQNAAVAHTITESQLDEQRNAVAAAEAQLTALQAQQEKDIINAEQAKLAIRQRTLDADSAEVAVASARERLAQAQWNLDQTRVHAPADGYVTNFLLREGQLVARVPRLQMYTDEKYVLMRVNHQAIRNVKVGQQAEFASPVYPGKIFQAEVEGIVEATGEAQGRLVALEDNVRQTTGANVQNKHHFVRLKLMEPEGYDIPVGAVGLAWISGEKPISFLNFLDVIRGIVIRMKAQLYYFYSI
ncbi:HlyD family secretion protein [Ferrimonas balearica]|uniref:HlyD family secretion protein n=1 Tax=Ferrimonas balearica TaxID=44012 RepID=UPI001C998321|nr:efflux RND transporter periplasmic adaptor subunit [Ferrimonas balearica]MBY5922834.1 biotin/lipoyl-binding protein [Ferrimonas balearica]MBY5997789.1 biotin/lipoyl-binding protein [Ferrimonas balearica]